MSTAQEHLGEPENVISMEEALRQNYARLAQIDAVIHEMLREFASRIHAFELAQDPDFDTEYREAREALFSDPTEA